MMMYGFINAQIADISIFPGHAQPSKYRNISYLCLSLTPISEGGGWKRGKRSTTWCSVVVKIVFLRFDSQLSLRFLIRMTLISFPFLLPLPFSPFSTLLSFSSLYLSLSSLLLSPLLIPSPLSRYTTHLRAITNLPSSYHNWQKHRNLEGWGSSNSWTRWMLFVCVWLQHDTQQRVRSQMD